MDYVPIRVSTLRGGQKTSFDIYIRIGQKNILYIRRGDSFEGARIKRLREKKLRKMYIAAPDEVNYRNYLQTNIEMAYDKNSGAPLQDRAEIVHGQQQANIEEVMEDPSSAETYKAADEGAKKYVEFLLGENEALKKMLLMDNDEQNLAHHSVTVATYSVALASKLKVTDEQQLQALTLAGLLHDIGHVDQKDYDVAKSIEDFTPAELEAYKQHPARAYQMLEENPLFDKQIGRVIKQHHELVDGSGFPESLMERKTEPNAIILSTAESLERLLTYEGMSRPDAMKKLMIERVGQHPLEYIQLLQQILKELDG